MKAWLSSFHPAHAGSTFSREFLASVVVFLVALPLCMGIAIASGVPPALGIVTGIVGGLVVGAIGGAPLQVSGPAAGLVVLVWQLVQQYGIAALGVAVLLTGAVQAMAALAQLGRWFRAVSPAVIQGMLAGIGVLIFASQFHVMFDDAPRGTGLANLASIPESLMKAFAPVQATSHHLAAAVGLVTILTIVAWNRWKPSRLAAVPAPLVGVAAGTLLAASFALPIRYVSVPADLATAFNAPPADAFGLLLEPGFLAAALALAVIASAETLLCASAVDQMHNGRRCDYNRELLAQGLGNMVCGIAGALPMTGVIVRSTANVQAGGRTRLSALLHGVWLLAFVTALSFVLRAIPTACLAAILVYTGYKLVNVGAAKALWQANRAQLCIYAATVIGIVSTDLLKGVLLGFGLALVELLWRLVRLDVTTEAVPNLEGPTPLLRVRISGAATFLQLPRLAAALESVPEESAVELHAGGLRYIDHSCLELIRSWDRMRAATGAESRIDWNLLEGRRRPVSQHDSAMAYAPAE